MFNVFIRFTLRQTALDSLLKVKRKSQIFFIIITATISLFEGLELKNTYMQSKEMHIVLAKNRDAIKLKGFQKWSNEMLEGVKMFPIAQKGL